MSKYFLSFLCCPKAHEVFFALLLDFLFYAIKINSLFDRSRIYEGKNFILSVFAIKSHIAEFFQDIFFIFLLSSPFKPNIRYGVRLYLNLQHLISLSLKYWHIYYISVLQRKLRNINRIFQLFVHIKRKNPC